MVAHIPRAPAKSRTAGELSEMALIAPQLRDPVAESSRGQSKAHARFGKHQVFDARTLNACSASRPLCRGSTRLASSGNPRAGARGNRARAGLANGSVDTSTHFPSPHQGRNDRLRRRACEPAGERHLAPILGAIPNRSTHFLPLAESLSRLRLWVRCALSAGCHGARLNELNAGEMNDQT